MTAKPAKDFGKRKPPQAAQDEAPARKRSSHVALLLMGTIALGSSAYALLPGEKCDPNQPAIAQTACQKNSSSSSSSSGSHGYYGGSSGGSSDNTSSGRSNFASAGTSSSSSSSSGSSSVSRGGFGSFMSHFSGGG